MTKKIIPFRTHYSPQVRVTFETEGESLTEQQFAEESQILNKIRKYDSQGFFDTINRNPAQYNDFTQVRDLADAIDQIEEAREAFLTIPSDVRKKFNNSPSEFFEFASKENNYDELVKLGLATAKVVSDIAPGQSPVANKSSSVDVEEKDSASAESA
jgi:phage internal scaffolding protein